MRGWAKTMLNVMLSRETDPHIGKPCYQCKSPEAPYRCFDCFNAPLLCQDCIINSHRWSPLHRILHWNGSYFERKGLKDLGYVLYLGHHGKRCHNQVTTGVKSTNPKMSTLTVVDTTGIHSMDVMYCKCPVEASVFGEDHPVQLWKAGFWPATYTRPQTVFSLHALRFFEALTLQAKTSAYDFIGTIRRLTSNAFFGDVKVRIVSSICYEARAHILSYPFFCL